MLIEHVVMSLRPRRTWAISKTLSCSWTHIYVQRMLLKSLFLFSWGCDVVPSQATLNGLPSFPASPPTLRVLIKPFPVEAAQNPLPIVVKPPGGVPGSVPEEWGQCFQALEQSSCLPENPSELFCLKTFFSVAEEGRGKTNTFLLLHFFNCKSQK